jgi:hypothetical protein
MKIKFDDFLKMNEGKKSLISLSDVENVIKEIFDDTKVSSVSTLYEEEDGENKLIITINNLFYEETNIIHTKFVFYTDKKKSKLEHNYFHYQYDINCNYKKVNFIDISELQKKLQDILNNRNFGRDIKILSDLSITIASDVNKLLQEKDINNISIYTITYIPIVDAVPCDSLTFRFDINIDDIRTIKMIIKKNNKDEFRVTFRENEWFDDVKIGSLKALPQIITEMIKKHIV